MNHLKNVFILFIIKLLFALFTQAFAIDAVRLEISKPDGSMEQKVKKLKRLKKNVYRLEMPISEIYGLKDIKIIAGEEFSVPCRLIHLSISTQQSLLSLMISRVLSCEWLSLAS